MIVLLGAEMLDPSLMRNLWTCLWFHRIRATGCSGCFENGMLYVDNGNGNCIVIFKPNPDIII